MVNSVADADAIALTCWGEARNQEVEGRVAVACVLRNRLRTGRWGTSYENVAYAPKQFSCWIPEGGAANYQKLQALKTQVLAGDIIDDAVYAECRWIADGLLTGRVLDRVQDATHYFEASIPTPKWAVGKVPVCRVGAHLFFAGIA